MGGDALIPPTMGEQNLEKVDWTLPGMDKLGDDMIRWITRLIKDEEVVNDISCLGWAFWPVKNGGYLDERTLRVLADFIEIQNKPFWDDYERYCNEQEPLTEQEMEDMKCLDELGSMLTPTSTTKAYAGS
jgi:hypothetical protein